MERGGGGREAGLAALPGSGRYPSEGWIRSLDRFVGTARPDLALGRMRRPHARPPVRLAAWVESIVGVGRPRAGDVVRRSAVLAGLPSPLASRHGR